MPPVHHLFWLYGGCLAQLAVLDAYVYAEDIGFDPPGLKEPRLIMIRGLKEMDFVSNFHAQISSCSTFILTSDKYLTYII